MQKRLRVVLCFVAIVACSSHTDAPRKAAADLEGSAVAGMSYVDFSQKLQAFGSAIALARREGASESALRPYVEAFDIYKDSYDLWTLKIDCPAEFEESADETCRQMPVPGEGSVEGVADKVQELASKYGVTYYPSYLGTLKKKVMVKGDFGGSYLEYPDKGEVRWANRNVFQKLLSAIWDKAEKKSKES